MFELETFSIGTSIGGGEEGVEGVEGLEGVECDGEGNLEVVVGWESLRGDVCCG